MRAARADWTRRRQPRMREEPHRLVFVDECGTKTNMTRLRGRARRGARVRDHAPLRHKGTQTFVAGLRYSRWHPVQAATRPVGNKAVQQALAGQHHFGLAKAAVLTNCGFTRSATELAASTGVVLMTHHDLPQADKLFLK